MYNCILIYRLPPTLNFQDNLQHNKFMSSYWTYGFKERSHVWFRPSLSDLMHKWCVPQGHIALHKEGEGGHLFLSQHAHFALQFWKDVW